MEVVKHLRDKPDAAIEVDHIARRVVRRKSIGAVSILFLRDGSAQSCMSIVGEEDGLDCV